MPQRPTGKWVWSVSQSYVALLLPLHTLCARIAVHARLFFQTWIFGSAHPYSGLHAYFSGQQNRVCTLIQVCTLKNNSKCLYEITNSGLHILLVQTWFSTLHAYSGLHANFSQWLFPPCTLIRVCTAIRVQRVVDFASKSKFWNLPLIDPLK